MWLLCALYWIVSACSLVRVVDVNRPMYLLLFFLSFLIGQPGVGAGSSVGVSGASDIGRSPWVYISVDGQLQSFRLFVYSVSNNTEQG